MNVMKEQMEKNVRTEFIERNKNYISNIQRKNVFDKTKMQNELDVIKAEMDNLAKKKFKPGKAKQNEVAKTYQKLNENLYQRTKDLLENIDQALSQRNSKTQSSLANKRSSASPRPEFSDDPYL